MKKIKRLASRSFTFGEIFGLVGGVGICTVLSANNPYSVILSLILVLTTGFLTHCFYNKELEKLNKKRSKKVSSLEDLE